MSGASVHVRHYKSVQTFSGTGYKNCKEVLKLDFAYRLLGLRTVFLSEKMCKHPDDLYTHTELATLPLVRPYGGYLTYFPNVTGACSQVSPPNPCWNYKKVNKNENQMYIRFPLAIKKAV